MSTPSISIAAPVLGARELMLIAYCTTYQKRYGQVTYFANKYGVSRQTIYNIKATYKAALPRLANALNSANSPDSYSAVKSALRSKILSLRIEGRCSITSIEKILIREGAACHSVGFISQTLTDWGRLAGTDVQLPDGCAPLCVTYAADEIYAGSSPILIVVEPQSLAVLRITLCDDRSSASWERQLSALSTQRITCNLIVKDDGTGMDAAFGKLMPDVRQQTDTFHAVAHRLGECKRRYERAAFSAIQAEYDIEAKYNKAKSEETRHKYCNSYFIAKEKADTAIALYDGFCFLYYVLLRAFQYFDTYGNLKNRTRVIADFEAALDLMPLLQHHNPKQIAATIQSIRACQPKLFTFLHTAQSVVQTLAKTIEPWLLKPLCIAWQAHKNSIKAKDKNRKKNQRKAEEIALNEVQFLCPNEFQNLKDHVYKQLNTIVQSSAAVECINSLLRPYLNNLRNQVSQETLNLFQFYHNHHAFDQGERKGKSPMQILTGQDHIDWIELLKQKQAA
jgi:hypothetical protein